MTYELVVAYIRSVACSCYTFEQKVSCWNWVARVSKQKRFTEAQALHMLFEADEALNLGTLRGVM